MPPGFYRLAAIASWLSVLTTLGLIFLPDLYAPGDGFAARMERVEDPAYRLRAWIYLAHPFLVGFAALAVALRLRREAPAWVLPGGLGFGLWAATEAGQQTLTLFAFDRWRRAWLAGDAAVRAAMTERAAIYDGLWDAMYVLLLLGFLIGCACYAVAMIRQRGLARIVGLLYAVAAGLTLAQLSLEAGGPGLPEALAPWLYPAFQPLARLLIGVWLWRHAREGVRLAGADRR